MNGPLGMMLGQAVMGMAPRGNPEAMPQEAAPNREKLSKGQLIAGILADALAGAMGRSGPFAAMQERRRQEEQEEVQWSRRRQGELADYEAKRQIDQRYPSDRAPYRFEDNGGNVWQIGPDGQPQKVFSDPLPKYVPDGVGGLIAVPGTGGTSNLPQAPRPVGKLRPYNPGGPTPPASGNFR